ncbi:Peptidoglycan-binding (PGRP) domain of peptidoglycan hydrolases-containing protein [Actinacidiphila rubida]|uniref:Peptidoglycan-binding (PGRP) domain of peptidoglycan hydrolases-containing protein n=2 Tax=Actinacidiphila rubida TaxID=310780 RepID=A0A1H8MP97_9ACTN|nr:L,D-transpeptidase family protein [Actinacidiphila rubida]SEO19167.1 Peptidoglycan-binding (PGRP) domain of peptidoglycan hydrolases-containing protein [Actinacidiphila rubida]
MAAATAALSAAVLTACGPTGNAADGKPSAPATATGTPSTSAPAAPSGDPTAAATTTPAATPATTKPAAPPTTRPPAEPVVMASGTTSAQVRELQARLGQLHLFSRTPTGYYGTVTVHAVTDFQERHGLRESGTVTSTTWTRLRSLTRPPTHREMYPPVAPKPVAKLDPRCMTGHAMCISKTTRTLSWVVDGKVQATMDVRFGSQYTPTREGLFHVTFKSRDHVSTLYHTAMPYAMFFSGGEAVHYSADFAARGYAGASHGCVNVRDRAAIARLFDEVKVGDKVVVYW